MIVKPNFKPVSFEGMKDLDGSSGYGMEKCGYVYLLGFQGKTKIGNSVSPHSRISESFTMGGIVFPDVWISDQIMFCDYYERYLHSLFSERHFVKEWFCVEIKDVVNRANPVKIKDVNGYGRSRYSVSEIQETISLF